MSEISNIEFLVESLKRATQEVVTQQKLAESLVKDAAYISQQRDALRIDLQAAIRDRDEFLDSRNELQARNEELVRDLERLTAEVVLLRCKVTESAKSLELFQLLGEPGERTYFTAGGLMYSTIAPSDTLYILDASSRTWVVSAFETLAKIREQLGVVCLISYEVAMGQLQKWLAEFSQK